MANEPSLSELTNINPEVPTAPVIDNSHLVDTLNQNARFQAENVWNKYNTFLKNKKDLFADTAAIQDLDTLSQDAPVLRQQAADIFKSINDNPSVLYGGKGFDEINSKISQLRSDAMASKQANLDYKSNKAFLDRNPELFTDENRTAIEGELSKPLTERKPVLLNMPTILDTKTAFEGLVKDSTHDYSQPITKDGIPYIESGKEINPNAIENAWNLISKGGQQDKFGHDLLGAVKYNYSKLSDKDKQNYEVLTQQAKNNGDVNATPEHMYWKDYGSKYLNAYFPDGSYTKTPEGNYRFAHTLTKDPYYLAQQQLTEKTENDKANRAIEWAKIGIARDKLNKDGQEDLDGADSVLNQVSGVINNGVETEVYDRSAGKNVSLLQISDPALLQKFGTLDREGNIINTPDRMDFVKGTNQVLLQYYDPNKKQNSRGGNQIVKTIPMDQRTLLKTITASTFPNKDIGGVNSLIEKALQANDNSIYKISQKIKNQNTKYQTNPAPKTETKKVTSKGLPIL